MLLAFQTTTRDSHKMERKRGLLENSAAAKPSSSPTHSASLVSVLTWVTALITEFGQKLGFINNTVRASDTEKINLLN